ncbi:MAG: type II secretion system F family protein, partial [Oscillospiraceae bacterium]|nr:type II secretion system F family protein [Oscillospiraceae bacterium]
MPKYKYTAIDLNNKKITAFVDARDEADFRKAMRSRNLVPIKFNAIEEKRSSYRLKSNEVADFSRQMSSMLSSGITAVRAMEILKNRDFKPAMKTIFDAMYRDIQKGFTVSETLRMQGRAFPELYINMCASGEASGQLEKVTAKMAEHYDKEHRLNGKVKSAMMYPSILAVATVVVVLFIFIVILPDLFDSLDGIEFPAITLAIKTMSEVTRDYCYLIILAVMVFSVLLTYVKKIDRVKHALDKMKLNMPVAGKLMKIIYTARFSRTLSSLYASGVSMIRALEITGTIIGNKFIEDQFDDMIKDVRNGEPLSASVEKIVGLDKKLPNTILIGEESGRLDTMLVATAESFDYDAEMA